MSIGLISSVTSNGLQAWLKLSVIPSKQLQCSSGMIHETGKLLQDGHQPPDLTLQENEKSLLLTISDMLILFIFSSQNIALIDQRCFQSRASIARSLLHLKTSHALRSRHFKNYPNLTPNVGQNLVPYPLVFNRS